MNAAEGSQSGDLVHDLRDQLPAQFTVLTELNGDCRDLMPPQRLADEAVRSALHLLEEGVALPGLGKEPLDQFLGASKIALGPGAIGVGIAAAVTRVGELSGESEEYPALGNPTILGVLGIEPGPAVRPLLDEDDPT